MGAAVVFMLAVVQKKPYALKYASEELQNDDDIMLAKLFATPSFGVYRIDNIEEEKTSNNGSQEVPIVLSDDINANIEKIDSMIDSLTSLKEILEEKRKAQLETYELDTAINNAIKVYNSSAMALMTMEETDKLALNSFRDKHEENGKQYKLENLL